MEIKNLYTGKEVKQILTEKNEFKPVFGDNVNKNSEKINKDSYKDSEKRTGAQEGVVGGIEIDETIDTSNEVEKMKLLSLKGQERLKYDLPLPDETKKRISANILGKPSANSKDNSDLGASTAGNEKFLKRAAEGNKQDNDYQGIGGKNQSIVQLGNKITTGTGKPKRKNNAFESKVNEIDGGYNVDGTKQKKSLIIKVQAQLEQLFPYIKFDDVQEFSKNQLIIGGNVSFANGLTAEVDFSLNNGEKSFIVTASNEDGAKINTVKVLTPTEAFNEILKIKNFQKQVQTESVNKQKMKRFNFKKTEFINEIHIMKLIPEDCKIDGARFYMKDKNADDYLIEWSDGENRGVILEHTNEKLISESFDTFKHLINYKSSDHIGKTTNKSRIEENKNLGVILSKLRG